MNYYLKVVKTNMIRLMHQSMHQYHHLLSADFVIVNVVINLTYHFVHQIVRFIKKQQFHIKTLIILLFILIHMHVRLFHLRFIHKQQPLHALPLLPLLPLFLPLLPIFLPIFPPLLPPHHTKTCASNIPITMILLSYNTPPEFLPLHSIL